MPWENPERSLLGRLGGTLRAAFAPVESAGSLSMGNVSPALGFALLFALPFMLAWGIVPLTYTITFEDSFVFSLRPEASKLPVWLDVTRASLVGCALSIVSLLLWTVPFASLLRAFSGSPPAAAAASRAAWRLALYLAWLVPCGTTLFWLSVWALPKPYVETGATIAFLLFRVVPPLLVLMHCQTMARFFGASVLGGVVVAFVPVAVEWAVGLTISRFVAQFTPMPAT